MNQNLYRSIVTLVVFWWLVFTLPLPMFGEAVWELGLETTGFHLLLILLSCAIGAAMVLIHIWHFRITRRDHLQSTNVRGLKCSIGNVPTIAFEPPKHEACPPLDQIPDVPADWYDKWFERYNVTHPAHADLMRALMRIHYFHASLPASHVQSGHGGRTLMEHSLLAGYQMDLLGKTWKYTGLRDRSGKRVLLDLRNPDYHFNVDDPLVALIGVAHDIGKIEAYIYDESRTIIGIHHEHDLTGARIIARIPEAWSIPDSDRIAMFLALAHYHHPMELPLSPDKRATDDRTIALMELLIKTDFVVSRLESNGTSPTEGEYEAAGAAHAIEVTPAIIFDALVQILGEHSRINSTDPRFSVGTLCDGQSFRKPMLILREESIRTAIEKRLHISPQPLVNRRHPLTVDLLNFLDARGLLYRTHANWSLDADNALWNVDFFSRPAVGAAAKKMSGWSTVIIVDPLVHPKIDKMDKHWWYAIIGKPAVTSDVSTVKQKTKGTKPAGQKGFAFFDEEEPVPESHTARSTASLGDEHLDIIDADDDNNVNVEVGPTFSGSDFDEIDDNSDQDFDLEKDVADRLDDNENNIDTSHADDADDANEPNAVVIATAGIKANAQLASPLTVSQLKTALHDIICDSEAGGITVAKLGDKYILSSALLAQNAPHIDWYERKFQLEFFIASGQIDIAMIDRPNNEFIIAATRAGVG